MNRLWHITIFLSHRLNQTLYGRQYAPFGLLVCLCLCPTKSICISGFGSGTILARILADKYGRRDAVMIGMNVLITLSGVTMYISYLSNTIELFILGRLFAGCAR
jgi:MFS family permease